MFKFNNTHIFTGYLKQLLANFNLPKYKIYTREQERYFNEHGTELNIIGTVVKNNDTNSIANGIKPTYHTNMRYVPYIKDDTIQEYIFRKNEKNEWIGKWEPVGTYIENNKATEGSSLIITPKQRNSVHQHNYDFDSKHLNYTKNLIIRNNSYDSYTHEYLGDYLRFLRDYGNLNLMPLYNCFSNRTCDNLYLNVNNNIFDTADTSYKIYMLPVKLFSKYTIAIDSELPIEVCCAIYGDYQDKREKFLKIPEQTYKKFNSCKFSQPILYDNILELTRNINNFSETDSNLLVDLAQNESDLKLIIKIPQTNESTIVVLEGDYRNWNDSVGYNNTKESNKTIYNFETLDSYTDPRLITNLQLLQFNTKNQIPFADRLVEYLIGNVITNMDENGDNIERAQTVMAMNQGYSIFKHPGLWEEKMRIIAYTYIQNNYNKPDINHDILGYIDKDVEKNYKYKGKHNSATISNIDIYEEDNFIRRILNYVR